MRLFSLIGWLISAILFLIVLTIPLSTQAQIATVFLAVAVAAVLKLFRPTGAVRMIALAIASSVIIRYIWWRSTETLPSPDDILSFIPGILLYAAEIYSVLMLGLSLFVVARPLDKRTAPAFSDAEAPSVDVLIPTYNESRDLLERTVMAASMMRYPKHKLNVYVLDDGSTEQKRNSDNIEEAQSAHDRRESLMEMCATIGVHYLSRAENVGAKAGNLNSAFDHVSGDLVVVFDADHAPTPDFLQETVGHFLEDDNLFLVQTPHFFVNPDPIERNLGLRGKVPSETEMFYGVIQRGLDRWNGSFFCGSAAVMRRSALDEVDGFSGDSITEDCETAVMLHARGWNSRYVDKHMISGLQPETFATFIGQRSRWAQGMLQIMILDRPLFKSGLSLAQRLCYSSSILFWLFPFSRLTFVIAPLFFLFFDLRIFTASGIDFLAYTLSYMAANLIIQNLLYGPWRRPWMSEVYEYAQSFHLGRAALSAIFNPTKPTFKVTAKDEDAKTYHRSDLAGLFYFMFFLLLIAQVWTFYRMLLEPQNFWLLLVVGGWNFLNLLLAGISLGIVNEVPGTRYETDTRQRAWMRILDDTLPTSSTSTSHSMVVVKDTVKPLTLDKERVAKKETSSDYFPISLLRTSDQAVVFQTQSPKTTIEEGQVAELVLSDTTEPPTSHAPRCLVKRVATGRRLENDLRRSEDKLHSVVRAAFATDKDGLMIKTLLLHGNTEQWRAYDPNERTTRGVLRGTLDFILLGLEHSFRGLFGNFGKTEGKK